jgi:hypothetical protein
VNDIIPDEVAVELIGRHEPFAKLRIANAIESLAQPVDRGMRAADAAIQTA